MTDRVLVVGATGTQGGAVADHLLDGDATVHALTRRPESAAAASLRDRGAVVVEGDLGNEASLETALADVDAAFCVTDYFEHGYETEVEQGRRVADLAAEAGLDHLVYSSVAGAGGTGVAPFDSKAEVEAHLGDVDLPTTVVRPTYFMQNVAAMRSRIEDGSLSLALPPGRALQLVDVDDLGALVADALSDPGTYAGETVDVAGDELTPRAMAVRLGAALDTDVAASEVPLDALRDALGEDYADMFAWFRETGFDVDLPALRADHDVAFTTFEAYLAGDGWA